MKTLIEKLKEDNNYRSGNFGKSAKLRWLQNHMAEATRMQQQNGNMKPHRSLTDYNNYLYANDLTVKQIAECIWELDNRRSYTTTPINNMTRMSVKSKRLGNYKNLLIDALRIRLSEMLDSGMIPPKYKQALGRELLLRERVMLSNAS